MRLNFLNYWYKRNFLSYLLIPFAILYRLIIAIRLFLYQHHIKKVTKFAVPVIVVGNITVGGTGKTPLVIWLADFLRKQGFQPGIVSRGYGGKSTIYPCEVKLDSEVSQVGDEALLIRKRTQCSMVIAPNRVAAVKQLLKVSNCNIVISDDGLQHYALERDVEIVVIDAERQCGNGFCLPAGPLRESVKRLQQVDLVVENGKSMQLVADKLYNLAGPTLVKDLAEFKGKTVHAVAGIGNPQRFFAMLHNFGLKVIEHPFPDHYKFTPQDLSFNDENAILMTEKDAVKCQQFADKRCWCVSVTAKLDADFIQQLSSILDLRVVSV